MLKLYKQIITAALVLIVLGSCTSQIDDVFEESALARLEAYSDSCQAALIEAEYGWVVNYYPNSYNYGGYTFIMTFSDDGYVTMMAEEGLNFVSDTSTYRVHSGQSTVLVFDTYSEFHYFSNAEATYFDGDDEYYIDFGTGYGGDFEFTCENISDNEIDFEGIKTGSKTTFVKLNSQEERDAYLGKQVINHNTIEAQSEEGYFLVNGNDSLELTYNNYHYFYAHYLDQTNDYAAAPLPFVVTEDGLSLYSSLIINGIEVKDFTWNESTSRFEAEDDVYLSPGGTVRGDFTDPTEYKIYYANFDRSSDKFNASVEQLTADMREGVTEPENFSGITDIRLIMNGYPTAQAYYNGSHRIDVYSEYAFEALENMFIFGTTATSMYSTKFNYGVAFSSDDGGTAGHIAFHSLVVDWFTAEFIQNYNYSVEVEESWSYGQKIVSYKLTRQSDPDYFIVFRPEL